MAPTPRPDWETSCLNHKTKEKWDCKSKKYPVVHRNATIYTLKSGKTAIVSFRVKNGTYSLLEQRSMYEYEESSIDVCQNSFESPSK